MSVPTIEKNDVDISKLFSYTSETLLPLPNGDTITIYQKLNGDAQTNRARVHALRESSKLRDNLNDINWKDRGAYIPSIRKFKKDEIVDLILSLQLRDISATAIGSTNIPEKPELDGDATLEEHEERQEYIDGYEKKFSKEVGKKVETELKKRGMRLNKIKKDLLIKSYESVVINQHATETYTVAYISMNTYFGTFTDEACTQGVTKTYKDFLDIPTVIRDVLLEGYSALEINSVELKKSLGAMRLQDSGQ